MNKMNTDFFTGRAGAYAKARPGYPEEALEYIGSLLPAGAAAADIGAGTGKLAVPLVRRGYSVWAVEPNADMRARLSEALAPYERAHIVTGTAEATTLPDHCVDAVVCAQALHWFDPEAFRAECRRIIRGPDGVVIAIYNSTRNETSYRHSREAPRAFFTHPEVRMFPNPVAYTREGWLQYMTSHSYDPLPPDPGYEAHIAAMNAVFDRESSGGLLRRPVVTMVYSQALQR